MPPLSTTDDGTLCRVAWDAGAVGVLSGVVSSPSPVVALGPSNACVDVFNRHDDLA